MEIAPYQRRKQVAVLGSIVFPALIGFAVLVVPLGGVAGDPEKVHLLWYLFFQVLYCSISACAIFGFFGLGLPGMPLIWRVLTPILAACVGILAQGLVPYNSYVRAGAGSDFMFRTVPASLIGFSAVLSYLIFALYSDGVCSKSQQSELTEFSASTPLTPPQSEASISIWENKPVCLLRLEGQLAECEHDHLESESESDSSPLLQEYSTASTTSTVQRTGATAFDKAVSAAERVSLYTASGSALDTWMRLAVLQLVLFSTYQAKKSRVGIVIPLYIFFSLALQALRKIGTVFARGLDQIRQSDYSMEIIADITGWAFYYVFYRQLFEIIHNWEVFVPVVLINVCSEIILYPMRMGKRYREFHARLVDDTSWKGIAYRIVGYEVDAHLLVQRVCLDYALRFVLLFSTGFALAVYLTFVRFGYNHHFYAIGGGKYTHTMTFLGLGLLCELLLLNYIQRYARRRHKSPITVFDSFATVFYMDPYYFLYFIMLVGHVITDTYLASMDLSSLRDER